MAACHRTRTDGFCPATVASQGSLRSRVVGSRSRRAQEITRTWKRRSTLQDRPSAAAKPAGCLARDDYVCPRYYADSADYLVLGPRNRGVDRPHRSKSGIRTSGWSIAILGHAHLRRAHVHHGLCRDRPATPCCARPSVDRWEDALAESTFATGAVGRGSRRRRDDLRRVQRLRCAPLVLGLRGRSKVVIVAWCCRRPPLLASASRDFRWRRFGDGPDLLRRSAHASSGHLAIEGVRRGSSALMFVLFVAVPCRRHRPARRASPIDGAWKITEIVTTGANAAADASPSARA